MTSKHRNKHGMKNLFARIAGNLSSPQKKDGTMPAPQPEQPFLAVGDLHGRADLLLELDQLIEKTFPGWPIVFLGDYIDRGEDSRSVLQLLMSVSPAGNPPVTCLMGNHERMLLDFIDAPSQSARRWIRNGGLQTLASFGVSLRQERLNDASAMNATRDQLVEAMGAEMVDWLNERPLSWQNGNVWAVHAGTKPSEPMGSQKPQHLLWGHPDFPNITRHDGQWIVHGHTIVETPVADRGRIAVDTGAYATGILTAAIIKPNDVSFIQTAAR